MASSVRQVLTVERATLERLAALLLDRVGLKIASEGFHSLRLALSNRLPRAPAEMREPAAYVDWLHTAEAADELRALLPLVTVGYTEFFRDTRQFRALQSRILPEMVATARMSGRPAEIWSAGCATGEEPYSLAIALDEAGASPSEVHILATDLNAAAVESARSGLYSSRRLSGAGPRRLTRYFHPAAAGAFEVDASLRSFIAFDTHNLASPTPLRIRPGSLDLILCRNVIIYFDMPNIRALMERFLGALRPGGYLFLGYSESLFKVYDRFEMVEVEGTFIYRKPLPVSTTPEVSAPSRITPASTRRFTPTSVPAVTLPRAPERSGERRITQSSVPAARLQTQTPVPGSAVSLVGKTPQERLELAVHHMDQGDFGGARTLLEKLTQDEPNDLDALLTLGNLHSLFGEHARAREVFYLALQREPLCTDARLFLGVAALQSGDLPEARGQLTRALFLEPTLALGHYLLAQVHERSAQHEEARRAYRNAIAQLKYAQRPLAGHYPDTPDSSEAIHRAARYALAALEER